MAATKFSKPIDTEIATLNSKLTNMMFTAKNTETEIFDITSGSKSATTDSDGWYKFICLCGASSTAIINVGNVTLMQLTNIANGRSDMTLYVKRGVSFTGVASGTGARVIMKKWT